MVIFADMLHGWGQTSKQLQRQGIRRILEDGNSMTAEIPGSED